MRRLKFMSDLALLSAWFIAVDGVHGWRFTVSWWLVIGSALLLGAARRDRDRQLVRRLRARVRRRWWRYVGCRRKGHDPTKVIDELKPLFGTFPTGIDFEIVRSHWECQRCGLPLASVPARVRPS